MDILIERNDQTLVLTLRDDGTGIAPTSERDAGLGMRIMNYRAAMIGGHLTVLPIDGGGTVVRCEVPYEHLQENQEHSDVVN